MNSSDAIVLLGAAIPPAAGTWADLGAGTGTFTLALAQILAPGSRIYAVDRDAGAVAALGRLPTRDRVIVPIKADFAVSLELPGVDPGTLDGLLLANALHFVRDAEIVLARLSGLVKRSGRVVIVEYDRRAASPWVPYPIAQARLPDLATAAGLSSFTVTGRRPSRFSGILYAAVATRLS